MKKFILSIMALFALIISAYSQTSQKSFSLNGTSYTLGFSLGAEDQIKVTVTVNSKKVGEDISVSKTIFYSDFASKLKGHLKDDANMVKAEGADTYLKAYFDIKFNEAYLDMIQLPEKSKNEKLENQINEVVGELKVSKSVNAIDMIAAEEATRPTKGKKNKKTSKQSNTKLDETKPVSDTGKSNKNEVKANEPKSEIDEKKAVSSTEKLKENEKIPNQTQTGKDETGETEISREALKIFATKPRKVQFIANTEADKEELKKLQVKAEIIESNISCVYNLLTMEFKVEIEKSVIELKTKYPIATKTNWDRMFLYGTTATGGRYKFKVSDLVKFEPDQVSKNKGYNWTGFDFTTIKADSTYKIKRKNWLTEALNFTAFYDVLSQIRAANDNRNNDVPVQMELNFNIPLFDWNAKRYAFWFPKMEIAINAVPAGEKAAPFHLLDSSSIYRTGKRSINFELLRDHYMNNSVKLTVFRIVPTSKEYMFFDLTAGFRSFLTNVKTRDLLDIKNNKVTNDSILAGQDVRATSFLIGPELGLRYECVFDKWFGADISFNTTYLRRPVGVKRDLENLMEDYQYPGSKYYSRDMWTISPEINLYFRLGKESKNPSGFMFRYRLYKDLLSAANPVHFVLIGYAANLKTMFK